MNFKMNKNLSFNDLQLSEKFKLSKIWMKNSRLKWMYLYAF